MIVFAETGAGKTMVAELAIKVARRHGTVVESTAKRIKCRLPASIDHKS